MRQAPGTQLTLPVINVQPDINTVGLDMTMFLAAMKVWKYALYAQLTGGTSCELWLYVRRANDDKWHLVCDVNNVGKLGGGVLPTGENYVFVVEELGIFDSVVVRRANDTGGVTVNCQLQEFVENNFVKGD